MLRTATRRLEPDSPVGEQPGQPDAVLGLRKVTVIGSVWRRETGLEEKLVGGEGSGAS